MELSDKELLIKLTRALHPENCPEAHRNYDMVGLLTVLGHAASSTDNWHPGQVGLCLLADIGDFFVRILRILATFAQSVTAKGSWVQNFISSEAIHFLDLHWHDTWDNLDDKERTLKQFATKLSETAQEFESKWSEIKPVSKPVMTTNNDSYQSHEPVLGMPGLVSNDLELQGVFPGNRQPMNIPVAFSDISLLWPFHPVHPTSQGIDAVGRNFGLPMRQRFDGQSPIQSNAFESLDLVSGNSFAAQMTPNDDTSFLEAPTSPVSVSHVSPNHTRSSSASTAETIERLRTRGTGSYKCPHGVRCKKGGVDKDGKVKEFSRNCDFRAHLNRHEKSYKCDLPGCPNKKGFARPDQLERHKRMVKHQSGQPEWRIYTSDRQPG